MGLSLLSALQIQGNETLVSAYKNGESGKHGFIVSHNEDRNYRPIVSSNADYDSSDEALTEGTKLRDQVEAIDLSQKRKSLVDAMGGEETAKTVDAVVQASKSKME